MSIKIKSYIHPSHIHTSTDHGYAKKEAATLFPRGPFGANWKHCIRVNCLRKSIVYGYFTDLRDQVRATEIPFSIVKTRKRVDFFRSPDISAWRIRWPPKPQTTNCRCWLELTEGYNSMNHVWWNCYLPQCAAERRWRFFLFVKIVPVGSM